MDHALYDWLVEDDQAQLNNIPQMGQDPQNMGQNPQMGQNMPQDPNIGNTQNTGNEQPVNQGEDQNQDIPDVSNDPAAPDMPEEMSEQDFEQWKNLYFKESTKNDVNELIDLIRQVRDLELDSYPRKFVEDNLQICFLRQNANIDKACKEIRRLIKDSLDQNNPSVSLVNHIDNALQTMPELNNIFIKLKGLLGMKADMHRKFISSLLGAVQVGNGGNNEDVIYNERDYSIKISTRYNDRWGRVDLGKWCLQEDSPEKYLTEPEMHRLEEGSPEEKEALRHRIIIESIADTFRKRGFIINVADEDGTIRTLGWDLSTSLKSAFADGKLVVKNIQGDNSEAMISAEGDIIRLDTIKIKYVKQTDGVDENGKPAKEENEFMERIDGILFLTGQFNIIQEAASSFGGIVLKSTPYTGNPSDLQVLQRCVPNAPEILLKQC
jgi:hypothetical protein